MPILVSVSYADYYKEGVATAATTLTFYFGVWKVASAHPTFYTHPTYDGVDELKACHSYVRFCTLRTMNGSAHFVRKIHATYVSVAVLNSAVVQ